MSTPTSPHYSREIFRKEGARKTFTAFTDPRLGVIDFEIERKDGMGIELMSLHPDEIRDLITGLSNALEEL